MEKREPLKKTQVDRGKRERGRVKRFRHCYSQIKWEWSRGILAVYGQLSMPTKLNALNLRYFRRFPWSHHNRPSSYFPAFYVPSLFIQCGGNLMGYSLSHILSGERKTNEVLSQIGGWRDRKKGGREEDVIVSSFFPYLVSNRSAQL